MLRILVQHTHTEMGFRAITNAMLRVEFEKKENLANAKLEHGKFRLVMPENEVKESGFFLLQKLYSDLNQYDECKTATTTSNSGSTSNNNCAFLAVIKF